MLRILTLAAAVLAPATAFAHNDGHAQMQLTAELAHMLSDPWHLALMGAVGIALALIWKGAKGLTAKQSRSKHAQD